MIRLLAALCFSLVLAGSAHAQGALYAPWQFLAGPNVGGPSAFANPRAIVGADLPNSIAPNSGTLGITNGGTGAATAQNAIAALLPTPLRPGDIIYWNGGNWAALAGNNLGTQFLSENAVGLPSWQSPAGAGTVTNVTIIAGGGMSVSGTCSSGATISCTLMPVVMPQGRLTLVSGTPVMLSDQTGKAQIFYDCYNGGRFVSIWSGTVDVTLAIGACEISDTMPNAGAGVTNAANVFDLWIINVAGTMTLCHATNGAGGGWASDTAGSNTARGTGYSQLDLTTRPYITNKNQLTDCYNGATQEGPIAVNQGAYVGTVYTTAAGQTGMAYNPTPASGGTNNILGVYNAYNRVFLVAVNYDNNASGWSPTANATWQPLDTEGTGTGLNNRISWVDGLGQNRAQVTLNVVGDAGIDGNTTYVGVNCDSTSATPKGPVGYSDSGNYSTNMIASTLCNGSGFHFVQAVQRGTIADSFFVGAVTGQQAEGLTLTMGM